MSGNINVLLLASSVKRSEGVRRLFTSTLYRGFNFRFVSSRGKSCDELQAEAEAFLPDVRILVSMDSKSKLVESRLAHKYPHLLAPSMESNLLVLHRPCSKLHVCRGLVHTYFVVDKKDIQFPLRNTAGRQFMQKYGDCYIQNEWNVDWSSSEPKVICNFRDDEENSPSKRGFSLSKQLSVDHSLNEELRNYGVRSGRLQRKYESMLQESDLLVIEVDWPLSATEHTVEGIVVRDGDVVPWCICDVLRADGGNVMAHTVPTVLSEAVILHVWAVYRVVALELCDRGFRHEYLRLHVTVDNGDVRVVDMSNVVDIDLCAIHRRFLLKGDIAEGLLTTRAYQSLSRPNEIPNRCVVIGNVFVKPQHFKTAGECISFAQALSNKNVELLVEEEEVLNESGTRVAVLCAEGDSLGQCRERIVDLVVTILNNELDNRWLHIK